MLGKLIKHEFLDTYKLLCVYYAVIAVLTIICSITINDTHTSIDLHSTYGILYEIIILVISAAYMIMLSILGLITILVLCSQFNKTMYGDRGYLTHTLPVSKGSILAAKYIVSMVWCIASLLVIYLSILVFCSFESGKNLFTVSWEEFIGVPCDFLDTYFVNTFGIGLVPFIVLFVILILVTVLHIFSFLWACISIGQLANEKRKLLGIISGICLLFAEFFIKRGIRQWLHLSFDDILDMIVVPVKNSPIGNQSVIVSGILIGLAFFAVETFITWFISSKKLNLA